jgi:hypothetical protein
MLNAGILQTTCSYDCCNSASHGFGYCVFARILEGRSGQWSDRTECTCSSSAATLPGTSILARTSTTGSTANSDRPAAALQPGPAAAPIDKLEALKAYRRAKGMCFTCSEHWSRDHQCKPTVQLHFVQELLEFCSSSDEPVEAPGEDMDQTLNLMLMSTNNVSADPANAIQLACELQGKPIVFLVDSGSTLIRLKRIYNF